LGCERLRPAYQVVTAGLGLNRAILQLWLVVACSIWAEHRRIAGSRHRPCWIWIIHLTVAFRKNLTLHALTSSPWLGARLVHLARRRRVKGPLRQLYDDTVVGTYMGILRVLQLQSPYGFSIKPLLDRFGFSTSFYTPGVDGSFDFHLAYPSLSFLSIVPFYPARPS